MSMIVKKEKFDSRHEAYSIFDPAIDLPDIDSMVEYAQYRNNESLKFRSDIKPTKFHIRSLTHAEVEDIETSTQDTIEKYQKYFQKGLLTVENMKEFCLKEDYDLVDNGQLFWEPTGYTTAEGKQYKYVTDVELEAFNRNIVSDIGQVIEKKTNWIRGSILYCELLPTQTRHCVTAIISRKTSAPLAETTDQ